MVVILDSDASVSCVVASKRSLKVRWARVRGEMKTWARLEGDMRAEGPIMMRAEERTWASPWSVRGMSLRPV